MSAMPEVWVGAVRDHFILSRLEKNSLAKQKYTWITSGSIDKN